MTDKNTQQEFVEVQVTPESMDAHVQCLNLNGYRITKGYALITNYILTFLLGAYAMGVFGA